MVTITNMIPTPRNDLTAHLTPFQEPPKKNQESREKAEIARGITKNYRGCPLQKVEFFFDFWIPQRKSFLDHEKKIMIFVFNFFTLFFFRESEKKMVTKEKVVENMYILL